MSNGKRRADAPGVLASTLDGAGWEFESQQDVEQGAEKRPRTKPECFEAGAAPPPSALHAAHRAKAAEEAAEEEAAEEKAAVNAQPVDGAAEVEMGDERASVAAEDEASETDEMEELPEEAKATGAKQTGLEPASWDDDEELEPETGHAGNLLPPRNALTTRCRHTALACTAASPPQPPVFARGGRCIQEYFEHEGMYTLMTRSARRRADLVGAIHAVQVSRHRLCTRHAPACSARLLGLTAPPPRAAALAAAARDGAATVRPGRARRVCRRHSQDGAGRDAAADAAAAAASGRRAGARTGCADG